MRSLFLFIGVICSGITFSQDLVFEHFSSNNGLSNNLVRDIIQDKEGYLWFATSGGLNRFDGHFFDVYKPVIGDTMSLSDSRLTELFQDNHGFIWARSSLGNIHRIDPVYRCVLNLKEQNVLPPGTNVLDHQLAPNGDIWLILNTGVLRLYYPFGSTDKFNSAYYDYNDGLTVNNVNFVLPDQNNCVWVGTQKGLIKLNIPEEKTAVVTSESFFAEDETEFISIKEFEGKLYFSTGTGDLLIFDNFTGDFHRQEEISSRLRGNINCITINRNQEMLLGTDNGDVIFYNPVSGHYDYYESKKTPSLDAEFISEIFADNYGIFWFVTEKRGVYQYNPAIKIFTYFGLNYENRHFLGEPDKQIFLEDGNGNLWIGINGGGLFLFNRNENNFKQYRYDAKNNSSISSDIILSLYEDRSKNLWIGTSYGGINKLSLKNELFQIISPVNDPKTSFDNYIRSVTTDPLGNIWVGSKAGKIYVYRGNKKIGTIPDDLFKPEAFPTTNVYCMYFDENHNLWVGTKGNGIYVFKSILGFFKNLRHRDIEVVHFKSDPENTNSLSTDEVYSIVQDSYGQYWIGNFSGGIDLLINPFGNPIFRNFSTERNTADGIVSEDVRHLFLDKKENLWVATSEGISILENKYLQTNIKKFINLSPAIGDITNLSGKVVYQIMQAQNNDIFVAMLDGGLNQLKAEDFESGNFKWIHHNNQIISPNVYSIEEDNNGNIWMGTDNGLFRLSIKDGVIEKYIIKNSYPPLTFSESASAKTLNQEFIFGNNNGFIIFHPDSIHKDSTTFPLKFSRLEINGEYINNLNSQILETSIEAQDKITLNHSQNNLTLYFSVLDFDKPDVIQYSSFLEGYDNNWSKPSTINNVNYRNLAPGDYVLKVKGTNSSGTWMDEFARLVIHINPPFWKSTWGYLLLFLIISSIVSITLILVYRQIYIHNKLKVDNAITEKRIEYYTNISNEFKTPLSLILNPVEEIILSHKSSDFAKQKGMQIKKNATYLNRLIDQILDFRKLREGKMQLKVSRLNLIDFFHEIYLVFLPLANKMRIKFDFDYNSEEFMGFADVEKLEKVAFNLLSNAFRFTPAGKVVKLFISVNASKEEIEVRVEDEGAGIDVEELTKIFDRFSLSKNSTGIGLFFTKEIVLLHKGEIDVYNNDNGGATFKILIPVGEKDYDDFEFDKMRDSMTHFQIRSIDEIETIISTPPSQENIRQHVVNYMETILVVEDNDEMRNYLCSELSKKYQIIAANDGEKGVDLARKQLPELIISVVEMPKLNGYELTKTLKEDFYTSHIPIFLLTAESSEEKKIIGTECGADDFIVKPFSLNYLLTKIEKTISQRKKLKKRFERDVPEKNNDKESKISSGSDFLREVNDLINQNLSNKDIDVEFLVEKMGVSRTLFFKKIKSLCGYAPNEYMKIIKMKEAAKILIETDKTINEISYGLGYNDSNYFGKSFKKHFGLNPSEFRSAKSKRNYI